MLMHTKGTEKKLFLGDYVTVYVQGAKESQANNGAPQDVLVQKEAFFQRIIKQRGEMNVKRHITDSVIIVDKRPLEDLEDITLRSSAG
jgi:sRNA-binding carbon storage regulator CsrA